MQKNEAGSSTLAYPCPASCDACRWATAGRKPADIALALGVNVALVHKHLADAGVKAGDRRLGPRLAPRGLLAALALTLCVTGAASAQSFVTTNSVGVFYFTTGEQQLSPYVGERLFCETCRKAGQTSVVRVEVQPTVFAVYHPIDHFFDELGRQHVHGGAPDPVRAYRCSRGHTWSVAPDRACWCGHPKSGPYVSKPGVAK